jgi:hypothetical protein
VKACLLKILEAMDHRVGITVASMKDLKAKMERFVEGGVEGLCLGEVTREIEKSAVRAGELQPTAIDRDIQEDEWSPLLER